MKSFSFALALGLCVCLTVCPVLPGHDAQSDGQAESTTSLAQQLKDQPDDGEIFNKYMIQHLAEIRGLLGDLEAAEGKLAEMREVIDSLKPETNAGKQLVTRAKAAIQSYGQQIELMRTTLDELAAKLKAAPDDSQALSLYRNKLISELSVLARAEPEEAERILNDARQLLAQVKENAKEASSRTAAERIESAFARLEENIEAGRKLKALIGEEAMALNVDTWVNGEPLTPGDLKGKVVLLDFWAVWCGPCIATFPHLREWHEKYHDQGLEIVGLTRYYKYRWDEDAGRATRAAQGETVTPEQEQEMLVNFAREHSLQHRFAIQKDSALSDYYQVTGIPHVVIIDREGLVRMIRVGSGEKNAEDIGELLAQLIAEK